MNALKSFTLTVLIVLTILAIIVGVNYNLRLLVEGFLSVLSFLLVWCLIHSIFYR